MSVQERIEGNVFGHVERMREERLVKRMYRTNVRDNRVEEPQGRRRDVVKELLMGRGLSEREGMVLAKRV